MKDLKIAVLNYSGNVGKTMVVNNLLSPNLPGTPIVAMESVNDDGSTEVKIKGKEFGLLQDELLINESLIVDIGASNIEDALNKMAQYKGSHEDFDYFILPTVPEAKQLVDTGNTVKTLLEMGIPSKKIRIVLNKVNEPEDLTKEFDAMLQFAKKAKIQVPTVGIEHNEVYQLLRQKELTLTEVIAMQDLRAKLKDATADEKREIASLIGIQRLALTAKSNLDEVFKALKL